MKINPKIGNLPPSATLSLMAQANEMRQKGEPVISLAVGEPDFSPPASLVQAAHQALNENRSKYTPAAGLPELKELVAKNLNQTFHMSLSASNLVFSTGGKQALNNVFQVLLEPGDEVLIPCPWWVSYPPLVQLAGGVPVEVPISGDGFIDLKNCEKKLTDKTKILLLNSPGNPSGKVISEKELDAVEEFVLKNNLILVSDELYASLVYGVKHVSPLSRSRLAEHTVLIGGFSKCYAMTGWRLGYSATSEKVAKAITAYQSHVTSNPSSLAQYAVLYALESTQKDVEKMRQQFDKRRQLVLQGLREIPGIHCTEPRGAFYAFPNVQELMVKKGFASDLDLCREILEKLKIAVVPGSAFGSPGHFRLSYATSDEDLLEALKRLKQHFS